MHFLRLPALILALSLLAGHAAMVPMLYSRKRPPVSAEMVVALPRFAQVVMAGGDRFLAADLAVFRALVASTETMQAANYAILGRVQSDASWFNPAHEDNYYIAAAILPWYGQLESAQQILSRASDARRFDWQPAFYYAFNELHFRHDALAGAAWLRTAADHARDEMDRIQLQQMAVNWASKAEDKELSIRIIRAMAKETRYRSFAGFLEKRAQRLENIAALQVALTRFKDANGRLPSGLIELVHPSSGLDRVPSDPFGAVYAIDTQGRVIVDIKRGEHEGKR